MDRFIRYILTRTAVYKAGMYIGKRACPCWISGPWIIHFCCGGMQYRINIYYL